MGLYEFSFTTIGIMSTSATTGLLMTEYFGKVLELCHTAFAVSLLHYLILTYLAHDENIINNEVIYSVKNEANIGNSIIMQFAQIYYIEAKGFSRFWITFSRSPTYWYIK